MPSFSHKIISLILLCLLYSSGLQAQFNSPLERHISLSVEEDMQASGNIFFSSWKPFIQEHIQPATSRSLVWNDTQSSRRTWWGRKIFEESLLERGDSGYYLFFDPVFDFSLGKESSTDRKLYVNTRGIRAGARLGKRFAFETDVYENQIKVPIQVDEYTAMWRVMPGQGQARRYKNTGWDFFNASGYISWSIHRSHNVQFGHGKHFVGDGYRSLLLSDNTFNYPYIKYTATFGRWQYVRNVSSFMNIVSQSDVYEYPKKTAGFDYLTVLIGKKLYLSLFESNIWHNPDSTGRFKPTFPMFNPIILTNTLFTKNSEKTHSLVGINVRYDLSQSIQLYGQLAFDDMMNTLKKNGKQIGAKYFNAFTIDRLFLQAEYNEIEKDSYSYTKDTYISYTHYNQAIAHPLGNNLREVLAFASYAFRRFRFDYRFNFAKEKDAGVTALQELPIYNHGKKVVSNHIQAAWIINPRTMMQLAVAYTDRNETTITNSRHTGVFLISFRTALRNIYFDF
ncbi:MAG: hypothetical protein LBQ60_02875 [Bacteroidales bacterium]|jgi:hypothetical protein|nr:hypothetical protein [Bacteroidales bacterium]